MVVEFFEILITILIITLLNLCIENLFIHGLGILIGLLIAKILFPSFRFDGSWGEIFLYEIIYIIICRLFLALFYFLDVFVWIPFIDFILTIILIIFLIFFVWHIQKNKQSI